MHFSNGYINYITKLKNNITLFIRWYNVNYKIIDGQKFARMHREFHWSIKASESYFRIIILVDKIFIDLFDMTFLNRLEKMQISFNHLLDDEQKNFIRDILDEIKFKHDIKIE